jgi:pimeloyl-ACP methyl ester carboxylesterase
LLLAHGAGGGIEANFGPVLKRLGAAYRTIGVDYPGSGHEPRSAAALTLDLLVDRLLAAADEEGVERFAVAGFSLGGPVAIRMAARHPERVRALVLTATFARANARLRLAADLWSKLYESGDRRLLAEFLTLVALSDGALETAGPDGLRAGIDALAQEIPAGTPEHTALVAELDVRADAKRITAPTLVLATRRDPLVSLSLQQELHELIPGARIEQLESGHLPFLELPDRWADEILAFLESAGWRDGSNAPVATGVQS